MKTITMILGMMLMGLTTANAQAPNNQLDVEQPYQYVEVRYYYYPNLQAYFDTKVAMYLFVEDGQWVQGEELPATARGYSLKNGQNVMITDYTGEEPYTLFETHKKAYPADYSSRRKPPVKNKDIAAAPQNTNNQTLASN